MLSKVYRLFEYAYLVIAVFFAYEAVNNWSEERNRAYLFMFFVIVAIFMFFFKRNFRKKMEDQNKN
jgi:FtsH-binding integral membrane protein